MSESFSPASMRACVPGSLRRQPEPSRRTRRFASLHDDHATLVGDHHIAGIDDDAGAGHLRIEFAGLAQPLCRQRTCAAVPCREAVFTQLGDVTRRRRSRRRPRPRPLRHRRDPAPRGMLTSPTPVNDQGIAGPYRLTARGMIVPSAPGAFTVTALPVTTVRGSSDIRAGPLRLR